MVKRVLLVLLTIVVLVGCGSEPTPTADLVATEVAVQRAAAATLTAESPTITASPIPATATLQPLPSVTSEPQASNTPLSQPMPTSAPPTHAPAPTVPPTQIPIIWRPEPYTVVGVASDDVLNLRSGPGVSYLVVGSLPPYAMGVQVGQDGTEVGDSLWLPVWFQGLTGWVNSKYLARQVGAVDEAIAARSAQIIMALRVKDMVSLSNWVHPDKGVRFSPYTYVNAEDLAFGTDDVASLRADSTVYHWGVFDGSGLPIDMTYSQYHDRFVYDADFAQPEVVGFGQRIGSSSMIDNISDLYPGAVVVEYHFSGFDPAYGGMDWRSLRLVMESVGDTWYLVGIVHDEWTT